MRLLQNLKARLPRSKQALRRASLRDRSTQSLAREARDRPLKAERMPQKSQRATLRQLPRVMLPSRQLDRAREARRVRFRVLRAASKPPFPHQKPQRHQMRLQSQTSSPWALEEKSERVGSRSWARKSCRIERNSGRGFCIFENNSVLNEKKSFKIYIILFNFFYIQIIQFFFLK